MNESVELLKYRFVSLASSQQQSVFSAPLLTAPIHRCVPESAASFYSPLDTAHNSDEEEELVFSFFLPNSEKTLF